MQVGRRLLSILLGIIVGLSLGLTGGGGAILAVPLLVYGLSVKPHLAVPVSLAAVGSTAAVGAVYRLIRQEVDVPSALLLAASGLVGAPLGVWTGKRIPESLLLLGFAALMLWVAVRMWQGAKVQQQQPLVAACTRDSAGRLPLNSRCGASILGMGAVTGMLSGMFGVGGGFIIVPALVLFTCLDLRRAVATSLLVIALISTSAVVMHGFSTPDLPWKLAATFASGGILGMFIGTWFGAKLPASVLKRGFSVVVVFIACYVIYRTLAA